MPVIDIDGVGQVEFPDDMSDEDISSSIKTNLPKWDADNKRRSSNKELVKRAGIAGGIQSAAEGIPVLGQFLKKLSPQAVQDLQAESPNQTAATRFGGTVVGSMPVAMAAPGVVSGAAAFGGLGMADKLAEKGRETTPEELRNAGLLGAIGGASGPVFSKIISPNALPPLKLPAAPKLPTMPKTFGTAAGSGKEVTQETINDLIAKGYKVHEIPDVIAKANAQKMKFYNEQVAKATKAHTDEIAQLHADHKAKLDNLAGGESKLAKGMWAGGGALAGHAIGGPIGGFIGAVASPVLKELAPDILGKYTANQAMASPANKAFLQAVLGSAGMQY